MMKEDSDQLIYRIAFSRLKGITVQAARFILERVGSERDFFMHPIREVWRITGMNERTLADEHRSQLVVEARKQAAFATDHKIRVIYFTDEDYPQRLLECNDAPLLLYVSGPADLNARHVVGIVGTRNATHYGVNFINNLVDELGRKLDSLLIVSGLALGCDIAAHRRALADSIPTVGVVAHGLDTIYPQENRNDAAKMAQGGGAVMTDYPTGTRPFRGNFLARNRIVAGMVDCLVVIESQANHGGALHTARLAREYNREVLALPGRANDIYSGGCNKLIRNKIAESFTSADELIETMGWTPRETGEGTQKQLFVDLSPQEEAIVDYLRQNGDTQINALTVATGIPVGRLMGMMMQLEMSGLVMAIPGSRYRLL